MLNDEDNNSHDRTLLHNVIKPSLLLLFWCERGPSKQKLHTVHLTETHITDGEGRNNTKIKRSTITYLLQY